MTLYWKKTICTNVSQFGTIPFWKDSIPSDAFFAFIKIDYKALTSLFFSDTFYKKSHRRRSSFSMRKAKKVVVQWPLIFNRTLRRTFESCVVCICQKARNKVSADGGGEWRVVLNDGTGFSLCWKRQMMMIMISPCNVWNFTGWKFRNFSDI